VPAVLQVIEESSGEDESNSGSDQSGGDAQSEHGSKVQENVDA